MQHPVSYCSIIYAAMQYDLILFVVSNHYKYGMIIFTPLKTKDSQNPKFFKITCAIGKDAGLKFLPDVTHPDRDWTAEQVDAALADPDSVIEFKQWEHIDLFKHSNRKKIIILDRFEPHDHLRLLLAGVIYKLNADDYYPRPPQHGVDYSWADLIICIQEELANGPDWIEFLNNPGQYFGTSSDRVISMIAGVTDDIGRNVFPYNALKVPLRFWSTWVAAVNNDVEYDSTVDRPFRFEALLGGAKENRVFLFNQLRDKQLLSQGLVSISAQNYVSPTDTRYHNIYYRTPELDHFDNPEMVAMREQTRKGSWVAHTVHTLGIPNRFVGSKHVSFTPYGSFFIPHRVYQNSWFSIIAESIVHHCDFFTEKTAKALFGRRIFVTFGPQHSLKTIRDIGFKTFGSWIDESYDEEPDDEKRWAQAFEQVVKLINHPNPREIYSQANSILEHNHQLITNPKLMLGPVDDFIQSFLNGTAQPDPAWKPIQQRWTEDQLRLQQLNPSHNSDLPDRPAQAVVPPGVPKIRALTNPKGPLQASSVTPVNVDVPRSNRLFNDPEILAALEQARAATRARRSGQVIS